MEQTLRSFLLKKTEKKKEKEGLKPLLVRRLLQWCKDPLPVHRGIRDLTVKRDSVGGGRLSPPERPPRAQ